MKIYIAGVGFAMGPLAFLARGVGHNVVCSDLVEHDLVEYMRENKFDVHIGQDGSAIRQEHEREPIEWFIHTAALTDDNAELRYAKEAGIKISKRDEFINYLLAEKDLKMIAIAGTHGKTNTTAMVAWCLQQADVPVSYSIGTRVSFGPFGKYQEGSKYFVYEADEFDRNFLKFNPAISVIMNIDFDHPDTYADQVDYDQAFAQFINQSDSVYMYADDFGGESDRIHAFGKDDDEASTTLPGKYIRQNARLVLEMLKAEFDIDYTDGADYINRFPGSSRRMEKIAEGLYSDYAHHPDEIRSAVEIGMELSDNVVVVYQPHQNLRQHEIMDSYTDCFEGADKVYWLPTYLSRENDELDVLSPPELIGSITNKDVVQEADLNNNLVESIKTDLANGATVIGMAAGDLDSWMRTNLVDESKF